MNLETVLRQFQQPTEVRPLLERLDAFEQKYATTPNEPVLGNNDDIAQALGYIYQRSDIPDHHPQVTTVHDRKRVADDLTRHLQYIAGRSAELLDDALMGLPEVIHKLSPSHARLWIDVGLNHAKALRKLRTSYGTQGKEQVAQVQQAYERGLLVAQSEYFRLETDLGRGVLRLLRPSESEAGGYMSRRYLWKAAAILGSAGALVVLGKEIGSCQQDGTIQRLSRDLQNARGWEQFARDTVSGTDALVADQAALKSAIDGYLDSYGPDGIAVLAKGFASTGDASRDKETFCTNGLETFLGDMLFRDRKSLGDAKWYEGVVKKAAQNPGARQFCDPNSIDTSGRFPQLWMVHSKYHRPRS